MGFGGWCSRGVLAVSGSVQEAVDGDVGEAHVDQRTRACQAHEPSHRQAYEHAAVLTILDSGTRQCEDSQRSFKSE